MQWLKTWLRKWLGVDEVRAENAELIQRFDAFQSAARGLSDLVWAELAKRDREDSLCRQNDNQQVYAALQSHSDVVSNLAAIVQATKAELIDIVKVGEECGQRITEIEIIAKDATLDTALAALEDRVGRLESAPAPSGTSTGRRGGSAWGPHQVAAAAGAARASGADTPIPSPGVS